jgi:hypothetical protein
MSQPAGDALARRWDAASTIPFMRSPLATRNRIRPALAIEVGPLVFFCTLKVVKVSHPQRGCPNRPRPQVNPKKPLQSFLLVLSWFLCPPRPDLNGRLGSGFLGELMRIRR